MHGRPAAPRAVAEDDGVVFLGRSGAAHPASHVAVVVFEPSFARATTAIAIPTTTVATAIAAAAATAAAVTAAAAAVTTATANFIATNAVAAHAASAAVATATAPIAAGAPRDRFRKRGGGGVHRSVVRERVFAFAAVPLFSAAVPLFFLGVVPFGTATVNVAGGRLRWRRSRRHRRRRRRNRHHRS